MFTGKYRTAKRDATTRQDPRRTSTATGRNPSYAPPQEQEDTSSLPPLVTEVMSVVRLNWDFMSVADFNPTPYALSLLDPSSLGREWDTFCEIHDNLEKAMDLVVNEYHEAFNISIQRFSSVVDTIGDSQRRVYEVKESLDSSKQWLESKRFDVLHLWVKSIQFKEMNRILDTVDELQKTPGKLEALIQGKFYLTAVRLLTSSLKTLANPEFVEIGALENIVLKLQSVKLNLHETLLDELQNHLYLKISIASSESSSSPPKMDDSHFPPQRVDFIRSQVKSDIVEDFDMNPELNSYQFMQSIIEALALLDKLQDGSKILKERIPIEVYHVVERVIQETDEWFAKAALEASEMLPGQEPANDSTEVLRYFLSDLYRRFESVVERSLFIDLVLRTNSKHDEDGYTLADVCLTIQNEVKTCLCDYLTSSDTTTTANDKAFSVNDILREKGGRESVVKQIFKITGTAVTDELERIYRDLDSGMSGSSSMNTFRDDDPSYDVFGGAGGRIIDKYANVVAAGHRLLITPQASNILITFRPTIDFMDKMEIATGVKASPFHAFMRDFILNVFLPQMDDQISSYFHNHMNGIDAFQTEMCSGIPYPLIKSCVAMVVLVYGMAKTIIHIPIHREEVLEVVYGLLMRYFEKCETRYRALTMGDQAVEDLDDVSKSIVSSQWVKDPEIVTLLEQNTYFNPDDEEINLEFNQMLSVKETSLEMKLKGERSFHRSELLFEQRKILSFANLHYGLQWMVTQINTLMDNTKKPGFVEQKIKQGGSNDSLNDLFRWSAESLPALVVDNQEETYLIMPPDISEKFENVLRDFNQLSSSCIYIIRLELRCHSMYYLDLALREGTYCYDEENFDPDPYIISLNNDLTVIEESIATAFSDRKTRFLFDGLAQLMTHILTSNLKRIRAINENGVYKLVHNVQSLQQNLTNLASVHEKGLDRARTYYLLLLNEGDELLNWIERNRGAFTFDEYKVVLDHIFAEGLDLEGQQYEPYVQILDRVKEYFVRNRN